MTASDTDLVALHNEAQQRLKDVTSLPHLEEWRKQYLSRKGQVPQLLRTIKDIADPGERQKQGQAANRLREDLMRLYLAHKSHIEQTQRTSHFDITVPGKRPIGGHLHPLTIFQRRIRDIFSSMGFVMVEGPLIDEPRYNFDALNIPLDHPARGEADTFYLTNGLLLRTHTSAMQVRAVLENNLTPPFRLLIPGLVFRNERTDATHETLFFQVEGIMIGKDITVGNFRSVVESFYEALFMKKVESRLRPQYFPFVEPGFEVDLRCVFCDGKGCRVCKQTGWIEVMGAGMVHPVVLKNMNINPKQWQGFAFGGSIDRLAMLHYGIQDIRLFWSGDLRFLTQFV